MAEVERSFLGMTHNPFVEPQGFFEQGGRKTHLEQLRHVSQWSRPVLLVTGPKGVGKTALYRQLAAALEPRVKAARISASLVNSGREVLAAIGVGFGLFVAPDANMQALRHLILEDVEAQSAADRQCLTLVDDAHLLAGKAVDELVRLTHESAMHLVLFGEVRMVPLVERSAGNRGVDWQEIRLTGYGGADAREYLEWRFRQARYRGRVPFTDSQVKEMVRMSEGLPGRLNQMANVMLVHLQSGEPGGQRRGFPRLHAAMLALLVTVTGLLYVALPGETGSDDAPRDGLDVPPPEVAEMPEPDGQPALEAPTLTLAERADPEASEPAAEGQTDDAPGDVGAEAPPEAVVASLVVTLPEAASGAETDSAAIELADPATDVEPDAGPAGPAVQESEVSPGADGAVEDAGRRDTAWLLAQDPSAFTLQLLTLSSLSRAIAFVDEQRTPEDFAIYQLNRDGRELYVVVYGLYATRPAAQRAADDLPPEFGDIQAWIRPLQQVQAAARLSRLE